MNILVLNNDLTERSIIQQVLQHNGHEIITTETSQAAWEYLQNGRARFVIADRVTTDMDEKHFIEHVRSGNLPAPVYILMISTKAHDLDNSPVIADDTLFKPLSTADLKTRVFVGERILKLTDNLVQARDQLEGLSMVDPLTNLLNQKAFLNSASGELERARRNQSPLSLIVLDIDNFKALNDQYGGQIGEDILQLVAKVVREKSRPYDCIGRWNDTEFISVLPGVIGADAEKVAGRIINGVRAMQITAKEGGTPLNLKMSAGVAAELNIGASAEMEKIIQRARTSMLRAKEAGGNQVYLAYI
jgi:diguanylate cyclase (GGDEF)-like protein